MLLGPAGVYPVETSSEQRFEEFECENAVSADLQAQVHASLRWAD